MSLRLPFTVMGLAARYTVFLGVWLMIANWKAKDLPVGAAASALALWISLSLLPPTTAAHFRFVPLARLILRLLSCSIIAGVDVARRALVPRLDLRPGFVDVPLTLPAGEARNAFLLYQCPRDRFGGICPLPAVPLADLFLVSNSAKPQECEPIDIASRVFKRTRSTP